MSVVTEDDLKTYALRLPAVGWRRFLNGISNRYDDSYPEVLQGIIGVDDFKRTMHTLHNRIVSHWPCDTCYVFGVGCAPCTLGLSLFCPGACVMMAEQEGVHFLDDISLSARYFDRGITWSLRKSFWESWVELRVPKNLLPSANNINDNDYVSSDNSNSQRYGGINDVNEMTRTEEEKTNLITSEQHGR